MSSTLSETTAGTPSSTARARMLSVKGEPLFYADWLPAVFIHFEVNADALQRDVPFELDLRDGSAYVSLVAFTLRNMRPRLGGKLAAFFFKPIATHEFLNVRAYVRHHGENGIYFLAEWLSNSLSVRLGPPAFGLPYRLGRFQYLTTTRMAACMDWLPRRTIPPGWNMPPPLTRSRRSLPAIPVHAMNS